MKITRTSMKQVKEVCEALTNSKTEYDVVKHEMLGNRKNTYYEYSIVKKEADGIETVVNHVTLKEAYEVVCNMLVKATDETHKVEETEEEGEQSAMEEIKNNAVKVLRDTVENAKEVIKKVVSMDDVELKDIRKYQWCVYGTADSLCKLGLVSEEEADEAREEIRDYGFEMFRQ